jgi:hypothetical protein
VFLTARLEPVLSSEKLHGPDHLTAVGRLDERGAWLRLNSQVITRRDDP